MTQTVAPRWEAKRTDETRMVEFAPSELQQTPNTFREFMKNTEFDDPSPSML